MVFSYFTPHDPNDPDGDPGTPDYGPNYYLLAFIKLGEGTGEDDWSFLVLGVEPERIALSKKSTGGARS